MPEEGNTGLPKEGDLPAKYAGKSAAEIAAMHEALEVKLGEMGRELGDSRQYIETIVAERATAPTRERQPADKNEYRETYRKYADDLLASPEEVLPDFADDLEQRVMKKVEERVSQRLATQSQLENFFDANPELGKFKEIVSVIGDRVYRSNPNADFGRVLEETRKRSLEYIATLKPRLDEPSGERKRAGITTGGSGGSRADRGTDEGLAGKAAGSEELDPDKQAVLDEIKRIRAYRAKASLPPRSR